MKPKYLLLFFGLFIFSGTGARNHGKTSLAGGQMKFSQEKSK